MCSGRVAVPLYDEGAARYLAALSAHAEAAVTIDKHRTAVSPPDPRPQLRVVGRALAPAHHQPRSPYRAARVYAEAHFSMPAPLPVGVLVVAERCAAEPQAHRPRVPVPPLGDRVRVAATDDDVGSPAVLKTNTDMRITTVADLVPGLRGLRVPGSQRAYQR